MRVPLSWLRDFTPVDADPSELAATLSGLGLVVEGMDRVGDGLGDIVVARVLATRSHPKADRVQLVDIDPGNGSTAQVVCGAFNFAAGDLVALAPVGAVLPGDRHIGRRQVRGEWSDGMLCSAAELGLSDDHEGILVLAAEAPPGAPLTDALGLASDVVFDIDVTPNRPDALSVAGVARDLAAKLKLPFALPIVEGATPASGIPSAKVEVDSPDLCPRFTGTVLDGVTVGPSPAALATRLTLAGMRPINNLVDVSNYVMLELGQPNHPYDVDLLRGGGLLVRRGRPDETLTTLDRVERRLTPDDCVICDAEGEAVGIGGIMGGASTEISDSTTTVLLEAAYFDPSAIARTSKRLGLRTEASVRFERGVDPEAVLGAVARFCQLAADHAGARVAAPCLDVTDRLPDRLRITLRTRRVNDLLGTTLSRTAVQGYLRPLGFECDPRDDDDLVVTSPSWRPDCYREIDLVEEVARHHGYAVIARSLPAVRGVGGLTRAQRDRRRAADILVGAGLTEAWSSSFLSADDLARAGLPPGAVEVENPLTADESLLRPSLLPGLLRALVVNRSSPRPDVRLFEMGHVFLPPAPGQELPQEPDRVAVALAGHDAADAKRVWDELVAGLHLDNGRLEQPDPDALTDGVGDATNLAGLHPARSARVVAGGRPVGVVGEVDPEVLAAHDLASPVGWFEVDLDHLLYGPRRPAVYRPVSKYPAAEFDLAFVVDDDVPATRVEDALRDAGGALVEEVALFDVFRGSSVGEHRRSLAYHLRFSALDHTLGDDELAQLRARCIEAVQTALPAQLRG